MPYTNAWSTAIPPGSLAANQIDAAIQQTRLDIAERINTLIGAAGSMSADPAINGTTAKSLTTLTTELATKTTLSGLTNGTIIQATGASSVANASVTNAQLVTALANIASLQSPVSSLNGAIAGAGTIFSAPSAGIYLVTCWLRGSSGASGTQNKFTLTGGGQSVYAAGDPGSALFFEACLTMIASLTAAENVTVSASIGLNTGNYSYIKLA